MSFLEFGASDVCSGAEMKVRGGDRASPIRMPLIGDDLPPFIIQQGVQVANRLRAPRCPRGLMFHHPCEMSRPESHVYARKFDRSAGTQRKEMLRSRPILRTSDDDNRIGDAGDYPLKRGSEILDGFVWRASIQRCYRAKGMNMPRAMISGPFFVRSSGSS